MNNNNATTPFWSENSNTASKEQAEKDLNNDWLNTQTSRQKKDLLSHYLGSNDKGEFGENDIIIRCRTAYKTEKSGEIKVSIGIAIFGKNLTEERRSELTQQTIQFALPRIEETQKILNWYAGAPYGELITPCFILECPLEKALAHIPNKFITQVREGDISITPTCVITDCYENTSCSIV